MTDQTPMAETPAVVPWPTPEELATSYPPRPVAMLREDPDRPASLALILSQDRDDGWLPVRIATPDLSGLMPDQVLIHHTAIVRRFDGVPHFEAVNVWRVYDAMRAGWDAYDAGRAAAQSPEEV